MHDHRPPNPAFEDPTSDSITIPDRIYDQLCYQLVDLLLPLYPAQAEALDGLINHSSSVVRDRIKAFVLSQGENSIATTLTLFEIMLRDIDPETQLAIMRQVGDVFSHHVLEVVSDSLDQGPANTPERIAFLTHFNYLAAALAKGDLHLDSEQVSSTSLHTHEPIDYIIGPILAARLMEHFRLPAELVAVIKQISLPQLLHSNLAAVANLRHVVTSYDHVPQLNALILEALAGRYDAVSHIISEETGYKNLSLVSALATREDSILIKVTMGMFIQAITAHRPDLAEFVNENISQLHYALQLSALLIGVWNDVGSGVLRLPPAQAREQLGLLYARYPDSYIRQALAPSTYTEWVHGLTTSEFAQHRANMGDVDLDWVIFTQLLKDATRHEHNVLLDSGGQQPTPAADWELRLNLLAELCEFAQYTEQQLGDILLTFPPELATVIRNAAMFHGDLYQGRDYYDRQSGANQMPIVQGIVAPANYRLAPNSPSATSQEA